MERSPSKVTLLLLLVAAALLSVAFAPTPAFAARYQNELPSSNDGVSDNNNNNNKINRGPIITLRVPLKSMILEEESTTDAVLPSPKSNENNNDDISPRVSLRSFISELDRKVGGDGNCLSSCTGAGQCAFGCYCTGVDGLFKTCLGLCCV